MFIDTSRIIHQGKVTLEDLITASVIQAEKEAHPLITVEVGNGQGSVPEITAGASDSQGAVRSIEASN
jgi:hypothetical protein